ncbi:hypothetical protein M569_14216 [Genlisea aurea]|uniref:methylated diphthine methylhydrolase n=1 Tax=Genlisea aurea TaxID=192259 RepID=S8C854_9LAMI|nr:hypothetical protein M569_14216 [Genlisea aurea]
MDVAHCVLEGNADAVEFCPYEPFRNLLAASTYVLQEGDSPSRSGSITLFDVDADSGRLELTQRVETAGVFDIKWSRWCSENLDRPFLAQADANGCVRIYGLQQSTSSSVSGKLGNCLSEVCSKCISSSSMSLCVDWHPSAASMAVGLSDGSVSIVSLDQSILNERHHWKAHDFELWAASFDIQNPMLVYTGSDDCRFSCWDLRNDPSSRTVFSDKRAHKMGVCSIAKSPFDPNTVLTGSYDESLRIWDVRATSRPVNVSSVCHGGGVWRIKHHPEVPGLALTACMHNGFAVVRFDGSGARIAETYAKHGSLAYGADWQRRDITCSAVVATCSFYDRMVRVWVPQHRLCRIYSPSLKGRNYLFAAEICRRLHGPGALAISL